MPRKTWIRPISTDAADLTIWWGSLTREEQHVLRNRAESIAQDNHLLEFLAWTNCPLIAQPVDPSRGQLLTKPGRFLTFLQEQVCCD
jgi:hypothetical protein